MVNHEIFRGYLKDRFIMKLEMDFYSIKRSRFKLVTPSLAIYDGLKSSIFSEYIRFMGVIALIVIFGVVTIHLFI